MTIVKKVSAGFEATLDKNPVKGGAWIARVKVTINGEPLTEEVTAWANASAGKRWVKEMVVKHTPRKSVKMVAGAKFDDKGKPLSWSGSMTFKREVVATALSSVIKERTE